ncbi:MAG: transposase, partial [Actinomycetota bacterium]|nr:transposase [Actinomycetota bacterium]
MILWAIEGVWVLRLAAGQVESLWDEVLPVKVRELPEDLRRIDVLLSDSLLLAPIAAHWQIEAAASGRSAAAHGRPTIAMETYVRLMVVKQRSGWGYETLVREVSDSLHLRRFCLIGIDRSVPDESTLRKLTRRAGVRDSGRDLPAGDRQGPARDALCSARGARGLDRDRGRHPLPLRRHARPAGHPRTGARARELAAITKGATAQVRDRSRSVGKTVRAISKTLARRSGQAKAQVMELNARAGEQIARSAREARRLAGQARRAARG